MAYDHLSVIFVSEIEWEKFDYSIVKNEYELLVESIIGKLSLKYLRNCKAYIYGIEWSSKDVL